MSDCLSVSSARGLVRSCSLLALFSIFALGLAGGHPPVAAQDASHGATRAVEVDPGFAPEPAPSFEEDERFLAPHPPLDQILPMPMPDEGDALDTERGSWDGSITSFEDGLEIVHFAGDLRGLEGAGGAGGAGYSGPSVGTEREPTTRGFGTMGHVTESSFPARMNVKLVMHFIDQANNDRFFVCSGSMLDAETVLTAAHCVYARAATGPDIFDWAQVIYVYPGWDGAGATVNNLSAANYGMGRSTGLAAGTNYINNGDTNSDVGLIRLNRAVGMLTGWYGWWWGGSCSFHTGKTYHNFSYPAQNCPISGRHNGRDMFYWYGAFNGCDGNRLRLHTGGGNCYDTVWGGMSGSGAYRIEGSARYTHAVASTSNRDDRAHYARIWETMSDYIADTFIPGSRTNTFDLQALDSNVSPTTIQAGQQLSVSNFLATNPTNGSGNGRFDFRMYMSTNDIISTADTNLGSQFFNWNFGAMNSVRVNTVLPRIPIGTPTGDYWIGARLDPGVDGASANNETSYWDATKIRVNGVADTLASFINVANGGHSLGDTINATFRIRNQGGANGSTATVRVYASTNTLISTADRLLGTWVYSGLTAGASRDETVQLPLPFDMSTGTYYVGLIVNSSNDSNTSNNSAYDATAITVDFDPSTFLFNDSFEAGTTPWDFVVP